MKLFLHVQGYAMPCAGYRMRTLHFSFLISHLAFPVSRFPFLVHTRDMYSNPHAYTRRGLIMIVIIQSWLETPISITKNPQWKQIET